MIRNLQKKFIMTAMISVTIVMSMFLIVVNSINYFTIEKEESNLIDLIISENKKGSFTNPNKDLPGKGTVPDDPPKDRPNKALNFEQYFIVRASSGGGIIDKNTSHIANITENEAETLTKKALQSDEHSGIIENYRFHKRDEPSKTTKVIVFLDVSQHRSSFARILLITLMAGAITWILLLVFATVMSKKAIQPIAENIKKQKQFITNAGHEIKTPLAIIQTNADVLTLHYGDNKWLNNIKGQVKRLSELTQDLLTLTKSDEEINASYTVSTFDACKVTKEILNDYHTVMDDKNISINDIEDGIMLTSSEKVFRQVISILLENAIKYTPENGFIEVNVRKEKSGVSVIQKNNFVGEPEENPERLFERFYRQDQARTQKTGGSGIGLSIARSEMERIRGKIIAEYTESNTICFKIFFPQKK